MSKPLTTTDLATLLGVDRRTIQRWCRQRTIPHVKIGTRTIRFLPSQVEEIVSAYTREVAEQRPEADIPNDRFRQHVTVVPMRAPGDAA